MSLAALQRMFTRLVEDSSQGTDGTRAALLRRDGAELGLPERAQLQRLLVHPGMKPNPVQLQANRIMPVIAARPLTCDWLSEELGVVMDAWLAFTGDNWVEHTRAGARFAAWLPGYLRGQGRVPHPALDALRYECALAELGKLATAVPGEAWVRSYFDYEPAAILAGFSELPERLAQRRSVRLRIADGTVTLEED